MKKIVLILLVVVFFALPAFSKTAVYRMEGIFNAVFKDQVAREREKPKAAQILYLALPAPKEDAEDPNLFPKKTWQSNYGHRMISCTVEVFRCPGCTYFTCGAVASSEDEDTVVLDSSLETTLNAQDSESLYKALKLPPQKDPNLGEQVLTKEVITEDNRFRISCHKFRFAIHGKNYVCQMVINGNGLTEDGQEEGQEGK
ncbi:MAG: hypothetical protein A2Z91_08030 [Deltaproteobacteria bacterium GWA2_38_16]|nr:MAG: hypothetical protein A2Z91_08030 [Deltaproteobacteria bacterium GWA2_38_16]OGQ02796.1 MAG: hypothetical protein A3D19_01355 [Deltaproteobacteria bacterium RIFCSPHIGHO2_02_FULL_38_15]OGQ34750.1 MAG: hypothetical protein A3A72_06675 [Deltaproteobacteria bacterium RIFCSPLOWO2_01_FULL_38_9]OGQ59264.1 MAG: hypothetical protein A3G92_01445 [Deltaproteobacteria bacterium RIFCSPLOWO2_12_FULL_38_8]HBQ20536.1 hypothetical protein [Deltaproteobacteria bacterium]